MVKSYLRFERRESFGVIASPLSNVVYNNDGKCAICGALEDVIIWNLKKGIQESRWHDVDNEVEVTVIAQNPCTKTSYAVGYADGSIRVWDAGSATCTMLFNGHRGAVTALAFDSNGMRLASGSKDNDLIMWDVVGEVGLYRLRGHKDQITRIMFLSKHDKNAGVTENDNMDQGFLLSSSKDTLLKLWDLSTQHCMETVVAHRTEIWDFDLSRDRRLLVTGSGDLELKIWKIDSEVLASGLAANGSQVANNQLEGELQQSPNKNAISFYGHVRRQSNERVISVRFHPWANLLAVHGPDKYVEIFRLRTLNEIRVKLARRKKRRQESKRADDDQMQVDDQQEAQDEQIQAAHEIVPHQLVRTATKVRSIDFKPVEQNKRLDEIQLLVSLTNNSVEVHVFEEPRRAASNKTPESRKLYTVDQHGHRSDVRTLTLSHDGDLLASASKEMLKIWNVKTTSCIRSMSCGYALCSTFLPGARHIVIGTKAGNLELFDIAASSLLESYQAHEGPIWSLQMRPDNGGLVTGSADKQVKFWEFELAEGDGTSGRRAPRLTLLHVRSLKMSDDVLAVRYSPSQKLIATALLDATVKVFYSDTLKFFLSLYGHKLPVLSMDISSDNKLIVTCSADKNVKLWSLDFGDCRRSIFAHQDSVMSVRFVPGTHYFFTASKDKIVKYWDGDKFENIMNLGGHHGEVWALAVSNRGNLVASGSHDRSIRLWEQTDEPLFLEEEREKELDRLYEATLTASMEKTNLKSDTVELSSAGKQTMETLKAGERIVEALDIVDQDKEAWKQYDELKARGLNPGPPPQRNVLLVALGDLTPERYLLRVVERIPSAEVEEALLILPFGKVVALLEYINEWASKEWNIPLTCRVLFHLLRVHHDQIVANRVMRPMLDSIRGHIRAALKEQKDTIGYNLAALRFIRRDWEANATANFFDEEKIEEFKAANAKKRKLLIQSS